MHLLNQNRTEIFWRKMQLQSKIQFIKNIFNEHLNQIRYVFKTQIIMMTERLSNTELKRVLNNKFASLLLRFTTALKLVVDKSCNQTTEDFWQKLLC